MDFIWSLQGKAIIYFGTIYLVTSIIRRITKDIDDDLSNETIKKIRNRLIKDNGEIKDWKVDFDRLTSKVWGYKLISTRSLFYSCMFTLILTPISFSIISWEYADKFDAFKLTSQEILVVVLFNGGVILCTNILADYISNIQTRYIIRSKLGAIKSIAIDLALTYYLISIIYSLLIMIISTLAASPVTEIEGYYSIISWIFDSPVGLYRAMTNDDQSTALDVIMTIVTRTCVLTTFSTSALTILYGASCYSIKLMSKTNQYIKYFDVYNRPTRVIGIIINIYIVSLSFLFGAGYSFILAFNRY